MKIPGGIYYWSMASGWTASKYVSMVYEDETLNPLGYFSHVKIDEINKKKAESAQAIANAQRRIEQEISAYEYQKSQNIFYIIYQLSPFSAATQATINFSNGEYGWGTFNAALALVGGAELSSMLKASSKGISSSLNDIWKQSDFNRNVIFRNSLAKTLYKATGDIAEARMGLLPVVDVLESGTGVAFRAVDDFAVYENGLKRTIDDLAKAKQVGSVAGMSGEVKLSGVRLDIAVPNGKGVMLPENIGNYAKTNGITVKVFEVGEEAGEIVAKVATAGSKLVDDLNLGQFVNKIRDYEVFENGEVFYRGMLKSDFEILKSTGKLPATSETFTSPTLEYIKAVGYGSEADGIERVIVKFQMKPGTLDELKSIGVRNDASSRIMNYYPDIPEVGSVSKWTENNALFKTEGDKYVKLGKLDEIQVNIGLGKGKALNEFNNRILNFQIVK